MPTQDSTAAPKAAGYPALRVAASSQGAEMASHEQLKARKTNFSLCQPCSLIRGGTLSQLSLLHSPDYTKHPALNPSITCPAPSALSLPCDLPTVWLLLPCFFSSSARFWVNSWPSLRVTKQ